MNQFLRPDQQFLEPQSDPSRVAMLVTLGFPLKPSGQTVTLTDVGAAPIAPSRQPVTQWEVGRFNAAGADARLVIDAWSKPLPDAPQAVLNAAMVCKLALHNRRCLLLQVKQDLPLWSASWQTFGKLGNWQFAGAHQVLELPSQPPCCTFDTVTAAVAATVGLQLGGFVSAAGRKGWLILPGAESCAYSPAQVLALADNAEYLRANDDALAVAASVLHNRAALLNRSKAAGGLNIFHRNGRYAVISAGASSATQLLAAQHLNI